MTNNNELPGQIALRKAKAQCSVGEIPSCFPFQAVPVGPFGSVLKILIPDQPRRQNIVPIAMLDCVIVELDYICIRAALGNDESTSYA